MFSVMSDEELIGVYGDYQKWLGSGIIPDGGALARARDSYVEKYDVHALPIMELDFLKAVAARWIASKVDSR